MLSLQCAFAQEENFSKECIQKTKEINPQTREDLHFESSMDDLVDSLQEKVLYMRTTDFKVCTTRKFVHGAQIALKHDIHKDPENNSKLETFYTSKDTVLADHH